ncbi:MAG: hypothetical protein AAGK14_07485 [Verrucomicrobiota bacterium]
MSFRLSIGSTVRFGNNERYVEGSILLGVFEETFRCSIDNWQVEDYLKQWKEGLARLAVESRSCCITNYGDPRQTAVFLWPLWREGDAVHVQNRVIIAEILEDNGIDVAGFWDAFQAGDYYSWIEKRVADSETSEWVLSTSDVFSAQILRED